MARVRLPVRTALLQNCGAGRLSVGVVRLPVRTALLQNSSTLFPCQYQCDYQSERHCSKTITQAIHQIFMCDYQSERHCSKTCTTLTQGNMRAITSQNGTAPKLFSAHLVTRQRAITSQNGTAPKRDWCPCGPGYVRLPVRTALLQNPCQYQPAKSSVRLPVRTALLQNRVLGYQVLCPCDYQSERHCSKTSAVCDILEG